MYELRDRADKEHKAYRLTVVESVVEGAYYGVQGTTWRTPPLLAHPSAVKRVNGRRLELFRSGKRLRFVAWRTSSGVYWVSNTLTMKLRDDQMLALAASLTSTGRQAQVSEEPPRLAWGMWKRFLGAMVGHRRPDGGRHRDRDPARVRRRGERLPARSTPPIEDVDEVLDDVDAGDPQTILVLGSDRRYADKAAGHQAAVGHDHPRAPRPVEGRDGRALRSRAT